MKMNKTIIVFLPVLIVIVVAGCNKLQDGYDYKQSFLRQQP